METLNIKGHSVIIDSEDLDRISSKIWHIRSKNESGQIYFGSSRTYLYEGIKKVEKILLHRYIMNVNNRLVVDHIDGDTLNNMKTNLRVCSMQENCFNRKLKRNSVSGYKGVSWNNIMNRWQAQIRKDYKLINLGFFDNPEEAHKVYCESAKSYFGEFWHV